MTVCAVTLWESLSEVEKTCLQVAFVRWSESHRTFADGKHWYQDPYGGLWVDACIPEEEQTKMRKWKEEGDRIADVMAVRTAELDSRIQDAVFGAGSGPDGAVPKPIAQLVIIGAGADMRAWRLPFPDNFKLFEVDSAAVLDFKSRVLSAAGPVFRDTLKVDRRELVADASKPLDMWDKLVAAGLDADQPVFWLLEGLIGYLPRQEGSELLATLHSHSAPGSRLIVTVPPGPAVKAARDAAAAAALAGKAAGAPQDAVAPRVDMGKGASGGVSTVQANMPHVTFEDPPDTLARVRNAGWPHSELLDYEWLANKYGVAHAQPVVLAYKE